MAMPILSLQEKNILACLATNWLPCLNSIQSSLFGNFTVHLLFRLEEEKLNRNELI